MWWTRSYSIAVQRNGDQIPLIHIGPGKYDIIKYAFYPKYSKSINIYGLLQNIKNLSHDFIRIEAEDKCELIIKKETTEVSGYFNEFEAFEIPTSELIKLVEEWYQFLIYYEEGNIPGIIPESKKQELVIVPLSAVKEEYLNDKRENPK